MNLMPWENPVCRRELLGGLRSAKLRWLMFIYMVAPYLAIVKAWPATYAFYGGSAHTESTWMAYVISQLLMGWLVVPIFAAYSVSDEFENRTAEALWHSMIGPGNIILGKMAAIVLICGLLQLASLPALSLIFHLGGVDVQDMMRWLAGLFLFTLLCIAVATCLSSLTRRGHLALVVAYLALPLLVLITLEVTRTFLLPSGTQILLPSMAGRWLVVGTPTATLSEIFLKFSLLLVPWIILFAMLAVVFARRPLTERSRNDAKPIDDPVRLRKRRSSWPYYLLDPLKRPPAIRDDENVVAAVETRVHPLYRSGWKYRALYAIPLVALCSFGRPVHWSPGDFLWYGNLMVAGIWIALVHAIAMTMDRQLGTFDALRVTPVTPHEYLRGKWLVSMKLRAVFTLVAAVAMAASMASEQDRLAHVPAAALAWWLALETIALMALAISTFCSSTRQAAVWSIGLTLLPICSLITLRVSICNPDQDLSGLVSWFALAAAVFFGLGVVGVRLMWQREERGQAA